MIGHVTFTVTVKVSMAVADGLVPIWQQAICNYDGHTGWSVYVRSAIKHNEISP